jgi:hypothetical protein
MMAKLLYLTVAEHFYYNMIYSQKESSHQAHAGRSDGITNVIPVVYDLLLNWQERTDCSVYAREKFYFSHLKPVKHILK